MTASACEEPEVLIAAPGEQTGYFHLMLVCPDLSNKRVKLGFAKNVDQRRKIFSTISPTIELVKAWPCSQEHETAIIYHVTGSGCKRIGREVFDVQSVDSLVDNIDNIFASGLSVARPKYDTFNLRMPVVLRIQMEKLAKKSRRTLSEEVKIAIEAHLAKEGLWPPQEE